MEGFKCRSPPKVRPITILRVFLAALPCISITISMGNSTCNSRLLSTGDGPWRSAPVGAVDPGLVPGRVVKAGLGGVAEKVLDPLLGSVISLGSLSLAAGGSFRASCLSAITPGISELGPLLATTENNSRMRGTGAEFLESTLGWEELPSAPAASFAICVETSRWEFGGGDRWKHLSLDSPSLRTSVACTLLHGDRHPFRSLVVAGSSNATSAFFPLLSKLPEGRVFGAAGALLEHSARETEDPFVPKEFSLLTGRKTLTPPPKLGLNFPNLKRMPRPAFRIL